ncbi:PLP-dependent aminotransferase family protein [Streptomyces sp. NPDC059153]|uniref:aminotransferase-like domain-containing protein n=1 Tax=unclassified Streptomyces TaxID=2593676 RepID=UPI00367C6DF2
MNASTLPTGLISGSSGPLYHRLAEGLRGAVRRGEFGAGSKLPSERDLARLLGISRTTVIGAYRLLREEGLLESERGSGTRIVASGRWIGPPVPAATLPSGKLTGEPPAGVVDLSGSVIAGHEALPRLTADTTDLRELTTDFGYQPLGLPSLRARIAARYTRLGLPTTADEVLVTSGAQQAISLLFTLFGRNGGVIVTENPGYVGALDAAQAAGATLLALPTDAEGIKVRPLRETLARSSVSLLYVMTTCQNPTGTVMSTRRRTEIARLAEHAGVPVVDDTTLADLVFEGRWHPLPTAASGVTIGSLSKLFWPGLRIGWLRAPAALMTRLARLKVVADLGSSAVGQQLASRLLSVSEDMAAARREQLTARLDLMSELLRTRLPTWSWTRPSGGPFLWVRLPYGDGETFARLALDHGVQVLPGARTSPDRGFADHLRLSFVDEPAALRIAVDRLGEAWAAFEPAVRDRFPAVGARPPAAELPGPVRFAVPTDLDAPRADARQLNR